MAVHSAIKNPRFKPIEWLAGFFETQPFGGEWSKLSQELRTGRELDLVDFLKGVSPP